MAAWDRIGTCRKAMSLLGMDKGHLEKKKTSLSIAKGSEEKGTCSTRSHGGNNVAK